MKTVSLVELSSLSETDNDSVLKLEQTITVTCKGNPVAQIRSLPKQPPKLHDAVKAFNQIESFDYEQFRAEFDGLFR